MTSESLYLICKHNHFKLYCEECLQEQVLDQICFWQRKQDMFLAFAMSTHIRLGSKSSPPEVNTHVKTRIDGKTTIVTTETFVQNRHCPCSELPDDVLEKIWKYFEN